MNMQLDKIGIGAGHLPMIHPFSMSINEHSPEQPSSSITPGGVDNVTRKDLLVAMSNVEHFDKIYIDLTNRAIQAYQASGRKRSGLKMHASLAALEE